MTMPRTTLVVALVLMAALPTAPASAHPFTLVNGTLDSVTAVAMASASAGAYEEIALGEALRGGRAAATVDIPAGDCRRNIRVTFLGGRSQVFPSVDVCRSRTLRLSSTGSP